ncbi:MAG: PQQ-binding-like beta-propeller repeat protein [Anaerolineae bacterium]|nr:PQQ-binding-like beta-propeller repeat protein [Anaerolineae bacterium]
MRRWSLLALLAVLILIGGCTNDNTLPTRTPLVADVGGRSGLPTIIPVTWRSAGAVIDHNNGASIDLLGTLIEHSATVNRFDFTADSRLMLTVDGVGTAILWDLESGLSRFAVSVQDTLFAYFNADASQILSVSTDNRLYFTTTNDGKVLASVLANNGGITAVAISADRKLLATGGAQGDVQIWNLETRGMARRLTIDAAPRISGLAFSPDGSVIAVGTSDLALHFYNASSGERLKSIREYGSSVRSLIYASDGSFVVAANNDNIYLYNTTEYARRFQFVAANLSTDNGLALSPDGKLLAAGTNGDNLVVWSTETGKEVIGLAEQQGVGSSLSFAPNGSFLLDTLLKGDAGSFLWSVASFTDTDPTVQGKNFNKQGNGVYTGVWTPDGKRIILADGSGGLYIYGVPG